MRVLRTLLLVMAIFIGLAGGGALYLTQPVYSAVRNQSTGALVAPHRLQAHVRMLSETLTPRHWQAPANLDRAAAYIVKQLIRYGGRVTEQAYSVERAGRYRNVIASFGPQQGPRVIVGAHYDALGSLPGADDNASGVAGLLELGRLLGETRSLGARVDLVAFTLEEPPHYATNDMGSFVHAAALKKEGAVVRAMISLEMIGYFTDAPDTQRFPHPLLGLLYPSTGDFITVVGKVGQGALVRQVKKAMQRATYLDVYSITAPPALTGVDFSDHRSFWAHGYRAVMITDTAFYRNDRYHTPRDTHDTLDYDRMAEVVRAVHYAVVALAK
ncbi:MAG TPA: M28 family peptidase [Methylomirabilota bacterium]